MKLVSLKTKKKLHKQLSRLGGAAAIFMTLGGAALGLGTHVYLQHKGAGGLAEATEKAELQEKIGHLVATFQEMQAADLLAKSADGLQALGTNAAAVKAGDAALHGKFNAEAEATAIALNHATKISPSEADDLSQPLSAIKPLPDYFIGPSGASAGDFNTFRHAQAEVMNRPGFTPTLASAREIAGKVKEDRVAAFFALVFVPAILAALGGVAAEAGNEILRRSIEKEENENQARAEAARKRADERRKLTRDMTLAKAAARPGKVVASMSSGLDRDIKVRQIKLSPRAPA